MAQAPAETPSAQPKSKSSKIWRRTRVGGGIAIGVVLILWAASALGSSMPVLGVSSVVLGVCIWELSRMGSFAGRGYGWVLGIASVFVAAVFALWLWALDGTRDGTSFGDATGRAAWSVLFEAARVGLTATLGAFALVRVESLFVKAMALAFLLISLVLGLGPVIDPRWSSFVWLVLLFFLCVRCVLLGGRTLRGEVGAVMWLGTLLLVAVPALAVVWRLFGHSGLVALLAIAKLGDTAGYYVGSTLGRYKPFKSISPNKTLEGCVGSLVGSSLAGVAAVAVGWLPSEPHGLLGGALAGAVVNLAAQASDLLESWVKRKAGVKDSGTWFATSGGMLDLVDSFFLATPIALVAWPLIFDFAPI